MADPVGAVEIAARLEVQAGTVHRWVQRGLLPKPRWTVSGNPAWEWRDIERWARESNRLPGETFRLSRRGEQGDRPAAKRPAWGTGRTRRDWLGGQEFGEEEERQ